MFNVTCLADLQRKAETPRRLGLGNPQRTALVYRYLALNIHIIYQYVTNMYSECMK
jgi:hypothetical protein